MCGIAGILDLSSLAPDTFQVMKKILARMQYRGPDESGIYFDRYVALGNVRLSIIDISTGQQPLSTPDKNLWIVLNGEIFNYIELKKELIKTGHLFHTESDTEVLLHAYQEYGEKCLNMLNGQFAFAIWNHNKKELFLARDRVGIRPLFYTWHNKTFLFGSEIKTLFEFPGIQAEFDHSALSQIFKYWTTISPKTVFKNIFELSPGHYMRITPDSQVIKQFWSLRFPSHPDEYFKGTISEAGDHLKSLLTDAVRLRLRADVPVAAYLSGGLDSSATTALIKEVLPETLQTFSIGFQDSEFDETPFQQEVSEYLNTRHTPFSCTNEDIGYYFPKVVWHAEIPVLRTAPVPMFCLSKKVRESNIKVVITGEGADEMLAGYDIFKEAIIRQFWSRHPDSKYRPLLLKKLYPYLEQFQGRNKMMLKFFFGYRLTDTDSPFYSHFLRWNNTSNILNYFSDEIKFSLTADHDFSDVSMMLDSNFTSWGRLEKAQWLEIMLFMSGYLLSSQGDRVAMANSVEGRYPFLDYRVIEFSATMPPDFKMHGLNEKYILKKIMNGRIPTSVLKRPKQAYRAPVVKSFFSSSHLYVNELLSDRGLKETGLFNSKQVQKLVAKVKENKVVTEIDNMALAGILSTQLLYTQYISRRGYNPELPELLNCKTIIDHSSK
ncbi:MAG: asparagine synthase (glutamine-hydrolyzing) [Bacteroidales bacterium]|nr:asparagine synthase (glutamine-hydrolyzing) [Bacteroidales bacterium]